MSFAWLASLDLVWAAAVVVALYVVLLVWSLTRARTLVYRGAPDRRVWRDLRLWILPLLLVHMALHLWLR